MSSAPAADSARTTYLSAHAERFVRSIREECLPQIVPLGERHRRTIVGAYVAHYHAERNHQGIGNDLIAPVKRRRDDTGKVARRERLGGLLNHYEREVA